MFRLSLFFVCIFSLVSFSQKKDVEDQSNQTQARLIIQSARQVSGLNQTNEILSYHYRSRKSMPIKNFSYENVEEISIKFPDKISAINTSNILLSPDSPSSSQLVKVWNAAKYKAVAETEISGRRIVKDVTNEQTRTISKNVSDIIGKKTATALQNSQEADPKQIFTESLWTSIFPLILSHPFEKNIPFKYAGKAQSNGKTANVVDVRPSNGKTYRLLFDSETNYLLMMVVSFKETNERFVGDIEAKYYFSERELIDGLLIPKRIKVEEKVTPEGKSPTVRFSNIEILDFKVNPKLDEKIFEIK